MTRAWKPSEHGPLERLEDNLWSVEAALPRMPLRRRMTVVRLSSGDLVIHSCIALSEAAMGELEAWGRPAFILVPNRYHRLDAPAYKARYPDAKVLCDASVVAHVGAVVSLDGTFEQLPADAALRSEPMGGTKGGEHVFSVTSGAGRVSLLFNDVLFNHQHVAGFGGVVLRLIGSSGGPRVTRIARAGLVVDRAALRTHFLALADTPGLVRIVVSHVDVITAQPAETLRQVAGTL
jgi:hypothetical protein